MRWMMTTTCKMRHIKYTHTHHIGNEEFAQKPAHVYLHYTTHFQPTYTHTHTHCVAYHFKKRANSTIGYAAARSCWSTPHESSCLIHTCVRRQTLFIYIICAIFSIQYAVKRRSVYKIKTYLNWGCWTMKKKNSGASKQQDKKKPASSCDLNAQFTFCIISIYIYMHLFLSNKTECNITLHSI